MSHLAIVEVNPHILADLFVDGRLYQFSGLPENAIFERAYFDHVRDVLCLVVSSPVFVEVSPNEKIPTVPVEVEAFDPVRHAPWKS